MRIKLRVEECFSSSISSQGNTFCKHFRWHLFVSLLLKNSGYFLRFFAFPCQFVVEEEVLPTDFSPQPKHPSTVNVAIYFFPLKKLHSLITRIILSQTMTTFLQPFLLLARRFTILLFANNIALARTFYINCVAHRSVARLFLQLYMRIFTRKTIVCSA